MSEIFERQTKHNIEKFDNNPRVKEKGRINVNFRDKDPHFSQRSAQPCQVYPELAR